ncbi:hypothetical protein vseg_003292 [Gypsophila vaccaria]
MGNYYSSCFNFKSSSSKMAKVVDSQGQVRLVDLPTTAAEIMLESPGFALTPVDEVVQSRRVSVMKADEVLLGRKVYLLVPVDKVNSRLSDLQLSAIDSLVCSNDERIRTRGGSKVSPVAVDSGLSGDGVEDLMKGLGEKCTGLAGQRFGPGKPWEPVLEPIWEVC